MITKKANHHGAMIGLIIGCIIFGLGSLIVATVSVGSFAISVWRLGIAGVIFSLILLISNCVFKQNIQFPKQKKTILFAALAGAFLGFDLSLWHESIYAVGPGISTLLNSLQIFFLSFIGLVFFQEKLTRMQMLSLFIAIVGVALIGSPEFSQNIQASWGFATGIISGGLLASSMASIRKVHDTEATHIIPLMIILNFAGAASVLPVALIAGDNFIPKNAQELGLIFIYGSVMQCLAWGLIAISIPKLSLAVTGLVLLSEPVAALVIDYLYLDKNIETLQWLGVLATLFAIYLGSISASKKE